MSYDTISIMKSPVQSANTELTSKVKVCNTREKIKLANCSKLTVPRERPRKKTRKLIHIVKRMLHA